MKKVNLIVAASMLACILNDGAMLAVQAQSFSSALLTDALPASANTSKSDVPEASPPSLGGDTTTGAGGLPDNAPADSKVLPSAMSPSPAFPFSFGADGKSTLNALPSSMHKAAASSFIKLLREHLLSPSGLLSLAMNKSPGSSPSDYLLKSGKLDGLLMIFSFIGSKVELSDGQIEQLHKIRNTMLDKSAPIEANLTILERKFREQLMAPQLDDKAMRSLRRQISRDKDRLDAVMTEHMIATSHVFTSEQRQKVRDVFMRMQAGPMGIKRPQEKKTTGD